MPTPPMIPRPAATLILTRDTCAGLEVFMMQRTYQASFMPGFFVFPGGAVDPADHCETMLALCHGSQALDLNHQLGFGENGLAYAIAAIRESFEEVGLLLARNTEGRYVDIAQPYDIECYTRLREGLYSGQLTFAEVVHSQGLIAAVDQLALLSRWVTPEGLPRRYDTRFFVAAAPEQQIAVPDGQEAIDHRWIAPTQALALSDQGEMQLSLPTVTTLQDISTFTTTAALLSHARQQGSIEPIY